MSAREPVPPPDETRNDGLKPAADAARAVGLVGLLVAGLIGGALVTATDSRSSAVAPAGPGDGKPDTYYVRADGGTAEQCTGTTDAPYSAKRQDGKCAWSHPFIALPPSGAPRIAGGDTLIIRHGSYEIGLGAPETDGCEPAESSTCVMAPVPGGRSKAQPTRVLGEGFDAGCTRPPQLWASGGAHAILRLEGASHVEVACLELTDRSACIKGHNHAGNAKGATDRCREAAPQGPWGENGVVATDSAGVVLRQLDIHGLAGNGIRAGRLKDWHLDRVSLRANGWAGWDGNVDGRKSGSSNSGLIRFTGGEIAWNGCAERYPRDEVFGCWAQQTGGYGDGLGTAETGGHWVFEDVHVHHNSSDGLDLLYLDGSGSATIRRVRAEGNAGNQVKTAGPVVIENSILVGNCGFFETFPSSNLTGKDHCRARGNTVSISHVRDSLATLRNNTITGQGDCLVITVGGNPGARTLVQNNALLGGAEWAPGGAGSGLTCTHYGGESPAVVEFDRNLVWSTKAEPCAPGNVCNQDPRLTAAPDGRFDAQPRDDSPLIDRATPVAGLDHDFHRHPRPSGASPDIGAVEVQQRRGAADGPSRRSRPARAVTAAVADQ